jgi:branched-chain amino acid transport system substrate-binding protein
MPTLPSPRTLGATALAIAVCVLAACADEGPVRIGDAYPHVPNERTMQDVVRIALDSMRGGRSIDIATWNLPVGLATARAAEGAAGFAATPGLIGVVGHAGSRDALLAATIYNSEGVPEVVPTATSRRLTAAGPWTFPLVPNDSVEGAFLADYAVDSLRLTRIAVLYVGDEYGAGLRDGVRTGLRARRLELVDETMVPNDECTGELLVDAHRLPVIAALRRAHPDVVILATGVSNAGCLAEIIANESPTTWMLGADGFITDTPRIHALSAASRGHIRSVVFWQPGTDSASRVFQDRWKRVFQQRPPSATDALVYDAFLLLATAVHETGGSRRDVRRWLESLGRSRPSFPGVSGPISFDRGRVGARLRMAPVPEPST